MAVLTAVLMVVLMAVLMALLMAVPMVPATALAVTTSSVTLHIPLREPHALVTTSYAAALRSALLMAAPMAPATTVTAAKTSVAPVSREPMTASDTLSLRSAVLTAALITLEAAVSATISSVVDTPRRRDPGRPGSDLLGMPASADDATPGFATELAQEQYRRADALTVRVAGVTYAHSRHICQLAGDVRCHAFFTWITIEVSCLMTGIFSLTDVIRARASVMGHLARGGRHRVRRWLVRSTQAKLGLWPRTTKVCRPSPCCA